MHFHNNRGLAGFKKPEYKNQDNSFCKTEILFFITFFILFFDSDPIEFVGF